MSNLEHKKLSYYGIFVDCHIKASFRSASIGGEAVWQNGFKGMGFRTRQTWGLSPNSAIYWLYSPG